VLLRIGLVAAVLASFVIVGMPLNGGWTGVTTASAAPALAPVHGPASTETNGLTFSSGIDSDARPIDVRTEFSGGTNVVWASFDYRDHDKNAKVTYLLRANGEDYKWGTLDCCGSGSGRAAFPITKRGSGGDLPGAAYEVRLFVNSAEVAVGGFGVKGRGGLDNDGQGQGNDND
jgi:hypothetical protein